MENFSGTALSSNWTPIAGTWKQNDGLKSPVTGQGWGTYIRFERNYVTELRTEHVEFTILSAGTVLGVGSARNLAVHNDPAISMSMFTIDATSNTLNIMNNWTEGATPTVLASTAVTNGVTVGDLYTLDIRIKNRHVGLWLTDQTTGTLTTLTAGDNESDPGLGYRSDEWGQLTDFPVLVAAAGQFRVTNFAVYADVSHPHIMFIGDSITEGYGVTLANVWNQNVGQQTSSFISAGRSGGLATGALAQMDSEVQYLRPDYLVIFIGTNDFARGLDQEFQSSIQGIVSKAASLGIPLIFGTLYPSSIGMPTEYNTILLSQGVPLIRFDVAMSQNHDGLTADSSLTQDGLHPNDTGNHGMMKRVFVDQPQMFQ